MRTDDRGFLWFSICSRHQNHNEDCGTCNVGTWVDPVEHAADQKLFMQDYAAWYRKANNGKEPDESAWEIRKMFDK